MSDEHDLHHLHAFLPRLAQGSPELVRSLPEEDQPVSGRVTAAWVRSLPPRQRLGICRDWVRRVAEATRTESLHAHFVLAASLLFSGEFAIADMFGVLGVESVQECSEAGMLLTRLEELGLLIYSQQRMLYCVPFPVRLAFERTSLFSDPDRADVERRFVAYCAKAARDMTETPGTPREGGWRFSNLLGAYELAVRLRGEQIDHDDPDLDWALVTFGMKLGRAAARRATDDGAVLIEFSANAAERICDRQAHVEMLLLLGKFWLERGQLERGMDAYRRCVEAAQSAEDLRGVTLASTALAFVMRDRGEREEAISQFRMAYVAATQGDLPAQRRDIANCAAQLLLKLGRPAEARRWLADLAGTESASGVSAAETESLLLHARACVEEGDGAAADALLRSAMERARPQRHLGLEARAAVALARILDASEDPADAETLARHAHGLFEQLGNEQGMAECAVLLSRAGRRRGARDYGSRWIDGALARSWAIRDAHTIARLHEERGELFFHGGDSARALAELYIARDEGRGAGDARYLAKLHLRIAEICASRGEDAISAAEALRAQGIARADAWHDGAAAAGELVEAARRVTDEELFDQLVQEVSDELESGQLMPRTRLQSQQRPLEGEA